MEIGIEQIMQIPVKVEVKISTNSMKCTAQIVLKFPAQTYYEDSSI